MGPTAVGKSDLAIELALKIDGEVINADAMQLYQGLDIATAKVPLIDRKGVVHHLLDIYPVSKEASVAEFQSLAREKIKEVLTRGVEKIYPVLTMTKKQIHLMLPETLRDLFWSCRTPVYTDTEIKPCGHCHSCVELRKQGIR